MDQTRRIEALFGETAQLSMGGGFELFLDKKKEVSVILFQPFRFHSLIGLSSSFPWNFFGSLEKFLWPFDEKALEEARFMGPVQGARPASFLL